MRVYHFLNVKNGMSDIELRRIRISRIRELNDPFELLAVQTDSEMAQEIWQGWVDKMNCDHGLLCFSKGWCNPVLWSHYASKHRGMCLGFDLPDEILKDIYYTKERLPLKFADDNPSNGVDEECMQKLLYAKYEHWAYEDEVRAYIELDHSTNENGSYFHPYDNSLMLG